MKFRSIFNTISIPVLLAGMLALTVSLQFTNRTAYAEPITDFDAGNIISDSIFYNKDTMTVSQIQAFLDALMPTCDTWGTKTSTSNSSMTRAQYAASVGWPAPPYVCINKYHENISTGTTSFENGGGSFAGGTSAAQIIYNASQAYGINPQVMLVLLKKESAGPLTSDDWPFKSQYKYAMGYACPDSGDNYSANCASDKAGFYKQMDLAAWQLKYYKDHPNDYRYKVGWNDIQYSPDPACGTKRVNVQNVATLSLYIYTPYTPNDAALANYPGTAHCGAYGNRNFYQFFKEWFGNPRYVVVGYIAEGYNANLWVGKPILNAICGLRNGGCYQVFERGTIYWSQESGAQAIRGGIKDKWISLGFENGALGYPTSGEIASGSGVHQTFQGGTIYWSGSAGAVKFTNELYSKWTSYGSENGFFGRPRSDSICGLKNNGCYQLFTKGTLYWTTATGAQVVYGGIKDKWISLGFENGVLGYPTSGETSNGNGVHQTFQSGTIYWSIDAGAVRFTNELYTSWTAAGGERGFFGKPTSDSLCGLKNGGCYQLFRTGTIYWSPATGAQVVHGGIKDKWISLGFENGVLGYPTSGEIASGSGVHQTFQGGTIYWTASAGASVVYN
jgi:hypothetical protein